MFIRSAALSLLLLVIFTANIWSAEPAYVTPEEAAQDQDFALQGEYVGEGVGVQVIALGQHQFRSVRFAGGLPGAGWDGSDRTATEGPWDEVKPTLEGLRRVQRQSPTLGASPPAGAVVLFDGSANTVQDHWKPGTKLTDDGLLMPPATTLDTFGDFTLHLEFRLPYMPESRGQKRGNSGCYLQGRYEVQLLDSFGLKGEDNECGGIYKAAAPLVNMCLPPLTWQTYDIEFTAARFDAAGNKTAPARVTIRHNGVIIQNNLELPDKTPGGVLSTEGPEPGPLFLQDHHDPVRFRNIWVSTK